MSEEHSLYDPIVFETGERKAVKVTIGTVDYILKEADGAAARQYRSASLSEAEMQFDDDDGTRTIRKLGAMSKAEPLLVSLCLFNGDNKPVSIQTIESWPSNIQKTLFERAKAISNLEEKEDIDSLKKQKARLEKRIARLDKKSGDDAELKKDHSN